MKEKPKRGGKAKRGETNRPGLITMISVGVLLVVGVVLMVMPSTETNIETVDIDPVEVTQQLSDAEQVALMSPLERGKYYRSNGRLLAAAEVFGEILETEPDNDEALLARAEAYRLLGDFEAATADYRRLLERSPEIGSDPWYRLASTEYEHYNRTDNSASLLDAQTAILRAVSLAEADERAIPAEYYELAGNTFYELYQPADALTYYETYAAMVEDPSEQVLTRIATLQSDGGG